MRRTRARIFGRSTNGYPNSAFTESCRYPASKYSAAPRTGKPVESALVVNNCIRFWRLPPEKICDANGRASTIEERYCLADRFSRDIDALVVESKAEHTHGVIATTTADFEHVGSRRREFPEVTREMTTA